MTTESRQSEPRPALMSSAWHQGASFARTASAGRLCVVADVIDPDDATRGGARRAIDALCRALRELPDSARAQDVLVGALRDVNAALFDPARSGSIFALAGAVSVTALLVTPVDAVLATVGSCRCYRLRGGVAMCLDEGHCAEDPMSASDTAPARGRDLVSDALGLREEVRPSLRAHDVRAGDRFFLCTSAVWRPLPLDAIARAMASAGASEELPALAHLLPAGGDSGAAALVAVR